MATAKQWEKFERDFKRAKKEHGFETFHTRKFRHHSGDFKGWSEKQGLNLLSDFADLAQEGSFTQTAVMVLDDKDYDANYRQGEKPRKLRLDSKYGLCFRESIQYLMVTAEKRTHRTKRPRLYVVMESGHPNAGDAERIFRELKADLAGTQLEVLESITFADKKACDPLSMADAIAYVTYLRETAKRSGTPWVRRPEEEGGSIITLRHKPGMLAETKQEMIARLLARGRPRRDGPVGAGP